jgi:hypothetical protein
MKKSDCTEEEWADYKAKQKAWRDANLLAQREKERARYHRPENKERAKQYRERPEIKARKRELERARHAAKRAASGRAVTEAQHLARLERQRKSRTGMTKEVAQQVLEFQNGCCAVCQRSLTEGKQARADHCHDTGSPRGILCHHCNIIEGMIRSMGIGPVEFGDRLAHYLSSPPFRQFQSVP